jgi:hypothetical protein
VDYFQFSRTFDTLLKQAPRFSNSDPMKRLNFWCEISAVTGAFRLVEPDGGSIDHSGLIIITGENFQVEMPLNPFLKRHPSIEGEHTLYLHSIQTETPLAYIGITKRRWFERLSEHQASAANGSRYFFHAALREHAGKNIMHKLLLAGINQETALAMEEETVAEMTLYPLGLNMIPGGKAGLKYLASLGVKRGTTETIAVDMADIMDRKTIEGRQNPLCSARWASDPDYAARVICGHSGRLTVDQVRMIRTLSAIGRTVEGISRVVGARTHEQVKKLLKSETYSRVL